MSGHRRAGIDSGVLLCTGLRTSRRVLIRTGLRTSRDGGACIIASITIYVVSFEDVPSSLLVHVFDRSRSDIHAGTSAAETFYAQVLLRARLKQRW